MLFYIYIIVGRGVTFVDMLERVLAILEDGEIPASDDPVYRDYKIFFVLPSDRKIDKFIEKVSGKYFKNSNSSFDNVRVIQGGEGNEVIASLRTNIDIESLVISVGKDFGVKMMFEKME